MTKLPYPLAFVIMLSSFIIIIVAYAAAITRVWSPAAPRDSALVVTACYEDEAHVVYFNTHACYPVDDLPEELASSLGVH